MLGVAAGGLDRLAHCAEGEAGVGDRSTGTDNGGAQAGEATGRFLLGDVEIAGGRGRRTNRRVVGGLAANHAAQGDLQFADAGRVVGGAAQLLPEHTGLGTDSRTSEGTTGCADAWQRSAQDRTAYAAQETLRPTKNATTYGSAAGLDELARGRAATCLQAARTPVDAFYLLIELPELFLCSRYFIA